jgi:hypothetical protein
MSKFNKKKKNIKWIITFILISLLSVSMIFAFVKIDKNEKTKTLGTSVFTYSVGLIDETGKYEEGKSSIYTKDYYSTDGLTIELAEDSSVTYKIFWYDSNKEFLLASSDLSADFPTSSVLENAKYFRLMVTPTNDSEVSLFEIRTYASQLTVTINK